MASHSAPEVAKHDAPQVTPDRGGDTEVIHPKGTSDAGSGNERGHGVPELVGDGAAQTTVADLEGKSKGKWFAYVKTKEFWLVLLLGQGMHTRCLTQSIETKNE